MFQYLGGAIGIAVAVLMSSRASSPGQGLEWAFGAFGILLMFASLLVRAIPELDRQRSQPAETLEETRRLETLSRRN